MQTSYDNIKSNCCSNKMGDLPTKHRTVNFVENLIGSRNKTYIRAIQWLLLVLIPSLLYLECSTDPMSAASPQDPPLPSTPSILPLAKGNTWTYSYTAYDSAGKPRKHFRQMELTLEISGVWGLLENSTLERIPFKADYDHYKSYVYQMEWDSRDSGYLVMHEGSDTDIRGLYIVGTFDHGKTELFDEHVFWLAFPGESGKAWNLPLGSDTASYPKIELVSTNASFYFGQSSQNALTPIHFRECYLFKESHNDTETFYYYHNEIGCLGYLHYENGILRKSYILTDYHLDDYGFYE